jgi:ribonuclease T
MKGIYISGDIESAGPTPDYSMLSAGLCVVGRKDLTFYRELKPENRKYDIEAIKVGALHLDCIPKEPKYDPRSSDFRPEAVLDALYDQGEDPKVAMADMCDYIATVRGSYDPILLTDVQPFDGSFLTTYLHRHAGKNPFGHKGRNIDEVYRGLKRDADASVKDLGIADNRKRPHHALEDAIFQSQLAEPILDGINPQWRSRLLHL